jgi:hypothetical protein
MKVYHNEAKATRQLSIANMANSKEQTSVLDHRIVLRNAAFVAKFKVSRYQK